MENFKVGDNVIYTGSTREQWEWGSCDRPYMLIIDHIYTIKNVEVHSQHTKIQLKGIEGRFNSVSFKLVD